MNRAVRKPQKRNKHTPDKRPRWVRRELELLGRQSDREVAALLGRSGRAVESKRFRLRISARSTHYPRQLSPEEIGRLRSLSDREVERLLRRTPIFPRRAITPPGQRVRQLWFAHEDALLGTRPDRVVGRLLGRTKLSIQKRRRSLGIAPSAESLAKNTRFWTPERDTLVGTGRDADVARKLGCSTRAVAFRRRQLEIPKPDSKRRLWTAEEETLLGTMPDAKLAKQLHRKVAAVAERRQILGIHSPTSKWRAWTAEEDGLLAQLSNAAVARRLDRRLRDVRLRRAQLTRLEKRIRAKPARAVIRRARFWTPERDALLGTRPDTEIAALLGCSRKAVKLRRRSKNIPTATLQNR